MAYKYQLLGEKSSPLGTPRAEEESNQIIAALKSQDHVGMFRTAADAVMSAAGGQLPSRDRLKRQQFTQDLIGRLVVRRSVDDE